jgi:hypothetical protein
MEGEDSDEVASQRDEEAEWGKDLEPDELLERWRDILVDGLLGRVLWRVCAQSRWWMSCYHLATSLGMRKKSEREAGKKGAR